MKNALRILSRERYPLFLLSLFYFLIHLLFLLILPLFEDEALYGGWSLEMLGNFSAVKLPLATGLSPVFSWINMVPLFLTQNLLISGRLISLIAGWGLELQLYFILKYRLHFVFGFTAAILFGIMPMVFVYAGLGLFDMLMVYLIFVSLALWIKLKSQPDFKYYCIFAILLFISFLTKPISLILIPGIITAELFTFGKECINRILKLIFITGIVMCAYILVFLPFHKQTGTVLTDFVLLPSGLLEVYRLFKQNLWLTVHWLISYFPISVLVAGVFGALTCLGKGKQKCRYYLYVLIVFGMLIPLIDKLYFPRHMLIFVPFIILMSGQFIEIIWRKNRFIPLVVILIIFCETGYKDLKLAANPVTSGVMAKEDVFQIYEDWTSGVKLQEVAKFIDNLVLEQDKKIIIFTDDSAIYYYGLPIYLNQLKSITFKRIPETREKLITSVNINSVPQFLIFNRYIPYNVDYRQINKFVISGRHEINLYKLN